MMAASATLRGVGTGVPHAPKLSLLWAIALAGCAAAAGSVALALTSDHVAEPGLQAALMDWMALPYVIAGVIAWRQRPESRFGPLMVVAGFVAFISTLAWSNLGTPSRSARRSTCSPRSCSCTCSSPFRSGRLERRFERVLVVGRVLHWRSACSSSGCLLGGFGPDNVLAIVSEPDVAEMLLRVQLVGISALLLIGVGVLVARRRGSGRPLRRSVALLVDCFALGLVMLAVLLLVGRLRRSRLSRRSAEPPSS